ncbi:hypothetical protein AFK24_28395 [Pseudomonas syringae]|uniref:Uncharacterized protein n=1 Tax=Pseudomonas syringae TaxID=317 RepID=A0A1C7YUR2_PSESX|nr:hypothetical protein AFK24_28395 [Pseudomonas syringae]
MQSEVPGKLRPKDEFQIMQLLIEPAAHPSDGSMTRCDQLITELHNFRAFKVIVFNTLPRTRLITHALLL